MRVASMFAGMGSCALGFRNAGYEVVWINDIDPEACAILRANFGSEVVFEGDITKADVRHMPDFDVLTAKFSGTSFCTGCAPTGSRATNGNLFFEISRVIDVKRPEAVLIEVPEDILSMHNGVTYTIIHNILVNYGYCVRYKLYESELYVDIPYKSRNMFIIALRSVRAERRYKSPRKKFMQRTLDSFIKRACSDDGIYLDIYGEDVNPIQSIVTEQGVVYRVTDGVINPTKYYVCPEFEKNMGTLNTVPVVRDERGIRTLTVGECLELKGFHADYDLLWLERAQKYDRIARALPVKIIEAMARCIREAVE